MTRFPSTRNLPEPSVLMGAEVPGGSPLRGEEPAGTDLGASHRNLDPTAACPMCEGSGERDCTVLGYTPVVAHRRDGEPWRAALPLEDLLELLEWRDRG